MSLLLPVLRPLGRHVPIARFWASQFYDRDRSAPPALSPTTVPFALPSQVKDEVLANLNLRYRYEWPLGEMLANEFRGSPAEERPQTGH